MANKIVQINHVYPEGEKWIAAAIEYPEAIDPESLSLDSFKVQGRTILKAYTNNEPAVAKVPQSGNFVILELLGEDKNAPTLVLDFDVMKESGFPVEICQAEAIRTVKGEEINPWDQAREADVTSNPVMDAFKEDTYHSEKYEKDLSYFLYVPKESDGVGRYPLVVFVPDRSVLGIGNRTVLRQGNGATVWAEEEAERPCMVLVPDFSELPVLKDHTGNDWIEVLEETIRSVAACYPVDEERIYGTGQSMGCMTCIELAIRHPDLYKACYLVAGQWDPERMLALKDADLLILNSQGDERASNGMGECLDYMESHGTAIKRTVIASEFGENQDADLRNLFSAKENIKYALLKSEEQAIHCHMDTWKTAYSIPLIREWLFEQ